MRGLGSCPDVGDADGDLGSRCWPGVGGLTRRQSSPSDTLICCKYMNPCLGLQPAVGCLRSAPGCTPGPAFNEHPGDSELGSGTHVPATQVGDLA